MSATLIALIALAGTASADVVRERLANGVRVVVESAPWNNVVSISVLADAGSRYDPPDKRGLARVTNGLLEYSTTSRSREEVCSIAQCAWVEFGTTLTGDLAEVYARVTDDHFADALDLVADAVIEPSFTASDLATVQVGVQQEIDHALDDPFERTYMKLNELLFEGHPSAFPVSGTSDGVGRITRDDVVRFHGERYVGGGVVVAIVGNVDAGEAIAAVRARFEALASGSPGAVALPDIERRGTQASDLFKDVEEGRIQIGFLGPKATEPDFAAVRVLTEVLGGGTGSRLSAALGDDGAGVSDAVGAFCPVRLEDGQIVAYATTRQIDRAVDLMSAEIERLRSDEVSADELERARNRIESQYAIRGERNLDRARRLAWDELSGLGAGAHDRLVQTVRGVTAGHVLDVARRYLVDPVVVILRPGRAATGGGI